MVTRRDPVVGSRLPFNCLTTNTMREIHPGDVISVCRDFNKPTQIDGWVLLLDKRSEVVMNDGAYKDGIWRVASIDDPENRIYEQAIRTTMDGEIQDCRFAPFSVSFLYRLLEGAYALSVTSECGELVYGTFYGDPQHADNDADECIELHLPTADKVIRITYAQFRTATYDATMGVVQIGDVRLKPLDTRIPQPLLIEEDCVTAMAGLE